MSEQTSGILLAMKQAKSNSPPTEDRIREIVREEMKAAGLLPDLYKKVKAQKRGVHRKATG